MIHSRKKQVLFRRTILSILPEKKGKGKAAAEEEVFIVDAEDFETVDVVAEPVVESAPVEDAATEIEV